VTVDAMQLRVAVELVYLPVAISTVERRVIMAIVQRLSSSPCMLFSVPQNLPGLRRLPSPPCPCPTISLHGPSGPLPPFGDGVDSCC
jgi:hypothetical protein